VSNSEFFVEAVAYQQVAIEEMERRAFSVQATGCDQLLTQLLGFGSEKHDDAVDALAYLILGLVGDGIEEQKVHYV
jgi:phage terminase large subunit-like protein